MRKLERSCEVMFSHKGESISQLLQYPVGKTEGLVFRSGQRSWSLGPIVSIGMERHRWCDNSRNSKKAGSFLLSSCHPLSFYSPLLLGPNKNLADKNSVKYSSSFREQSAKCWPWLRTMYGQISHAQLLSYLMIRCQAINCGNH